MGTRKEDCVEGEPDADAEAGWDFKCIGLDCDAACPGEQVSRRR